MYSISIINNENIPEKWGDYTVHKEFYITNNLKNKNKNIGVNGFIVQIIIKRTDAYALCGDGYIKKIIDIDEFTNNQVQFMNDSYIELFPIINGVCEYGDNFQNGELLQYEKYKGKYYTNDNPPTLGKIQQIGQIIFIPVEDIEIVKTVLYRIENPSNNTKLTILGLEWNLSENTPANGLPYRHYNLKDINTLSKLKNSNYIEHRVIAEWNGLIEKDNEIILSKNNNTKKINSMIDCIKLPYDSKLISRNRVLVAKTKLSSEFIET